MIRITALLFLCLRAAGTDAQSVTDTFKVYFPSGRDDLPAAAQAQIDSLLYHNLLPAPLELYGYGDDVGEDAYNRRLSARRAAAVKAYLVRSGWGAEQITVCKGKGKIVHAGGRGRTGHAGDRRVDLIAGGRVPDEVAKAPEPVAAPAPVVKDISKMKVNETFALDNIQFMPGISVMEPSAEPVVKELLCMLEEHGTVKIRLEGHIHGTGTEGDYDPIDEYTDLPLSVARAKRVYDYLVAAGIPATRLSYKGFGSQFPLVRNARSHKDTQRNRRVEVRILSK